MPGESATDADVAPDFMYLAYDTTELQSSFVLTSGDTAYFWLSDIEGGNCLLTQMVVFPEYYRLVR